MKLLYFDLRGRAEMIRLALHAGGVEFEDARFARGGTCASGARAVQVGAALRYLATSCFFSLRCLLLLLTQYH